MDENKIMAYMEKNKLKTVLTVQLDLKRPFSYVSFEVSKEGDVYVPQINKFVAEPDVVIRVPATATHIFDGEKHE